jgi:hypothetical protein
MRRRNQLLHGKHALLMGVYIYWWVRSAMTFGGAWNRGKFEGKNNTGERKRENRH